MKTYKKILRKTLSAAILVVIIVSLFHGCTDPDFLDTGITPSKVEGRVTGDNGFSRIAKSNSSIEGATVILARMKADGSLETVSNQAAQTDADGKFVLETDVDGESNLIVVATKGNDVWKAVVTSEVRSGIGVYCQPLNNETTAETEVYVEAETAGSNNLTYAEVSNSINANTAAYIKNNSPVIEQVSASLIIQSEASVSAFTNSGIGGNIGQWQIILEAIISAQATLERDLYFATTQTSIDAAFESYSESFINAFVSAGFSEEIFVKVLEISNSVFIKAIVNLSPEARFEFEKRIAEIRAKAIDISVQAKFAQLSASTGQIDAIINAGQSLKVSIDVVSASTEIVSAFDAYHSEVISQLVITLGVHGNLIAAIETNVIGFNTTLESSVNSSLSTGDIINAYMNFYSQVTSEVEIVMTAASDVQVSATAEILILLNIFFN